MLNLIVALMVAGDIQCFCGSKHKFWVQIWCLNVTCCWCPLILNMSD